MGDLTPEQLLVLADAAGLRLLDEDVEPLTLQLNALIEGLGTLDAHDLDGVAPLPALQHPAELPHHDRTPPPPLATETGAPLAYKPITELAHLMHSGELSPVELTEAYLDRIERFDGELHSYITVTAELARRQAREAEAALRGGDAGPLTGVPLAHKDEFYTKGILTTCGSAILSEFVPEYDATVIAKLHEAGAVMLGKLNMTEWASPLTWEFPYGQPRNPWDLEYDAGGSSTGSGIATAAGLCAGSMGEDTGGSIRRPASCNSAVGLRPSWGRVSTYGLIPASWYQDTAAPLARTVADCALILNAVAGHDPLDPMSARLPVPDYTGVLDGEVRGLRIGLVQEAIHSAHLDPEVKARVLEAAKVFEGLGATVEEVSVPLMADGGLINGALGSPRTALHWRHLAEAAADYDTGVRLYTVLPGLIPAVLYQRALQLRSLLRAQVLAATERFDVLISPAYPAPPPRIEDTKSPPRSKEQAVEQMHKFSYTAPANYAGLPAISVPAGFSERGLPIGLQIMAKRFDEESVFRAAHAFEVATPWHTMRPPVGDD